MHPRGAAVVIELPAAEPEQPPALVDDEDSVPASPLLAAASPRAL
jgi:hypothetical protein